MSTEDFLLDCEVRTDVGKGASRRLRRLDNNIPAVLYGGGKETISLTIPHKDIAKAIENEAFFAHIITLNIAGKSEKAVIKDLQRHPAKPFVLHADFLRIDDKKSIQIKVPLHFINEDRCVGVKIGGGNIQKTLTQIEVECLPQDLPEYIEVDMLDVDVGTTLHLSDITLPDTVTSVALSHGEDNDYAIASIVIPRGEKIADEAEEGVSEESDSGESTEEDKG
jgi:large subunit ribosomal protein L25